MSEGATTWATVALCVASVAWPPGPGPSAAGAPAGSAGQAASRIRFVDVTDRLGIDFVHSRIDTPQKHVAETTGSGVAWIDYDADGRPDLYFTDATEVPTGLGEPAAAGGRNVLYRQAPGPRLRRADRAGLADPGYGQGVSVADFDADGWPDLFLANLGPNRLFRNNGDGTFDPVPLPEAADEPPWTSSVAWGDLDLDGWPDLFAVSYLRYDTASPPVCGRLDQGIRTYCPPTYFPGTRDLLYRNLGDGTFAEMAVAAGVANAAEGKGLGVVIGDVDLDGLPDIYVANDTTRNFLYRNLGEMTFEDRGVLSGAGYGDSGRAQSGMGTDLGDVDGDGRPDLVVTNFAGEPYNLYRSVAEGIFVDETFAAGIGMPTLPLLGFGIALADLDGDLDLDLSIANGHLHQHLEDYGQPNQVFANERLQPVAGAAGPGRFVDVSDDAGAALLRRRVSRGLAVGDVDGDGWPDLAITNVADRAEVLLNVTETRNRRLVLRLRGRSATRDALHTRVRVLPEPVAADSPRQELEVKSASSYYSHPSGDLYVGLGEARSATLEIAWPDGERRRLAGVPAGHLLLIVQGRGIVARRALSPRMPTS